MESSRPEFERIVAVVVRRFQAQTGRPLAEMDMPRFTAQLWALIQERGLPPPLRNEDPGTPGGMPEGECAALVARAVAGLAEPSLADVARQLVKACFYPEFTVCRDSFREVARDGSCRRQELDRARGRVSGAHCVDCPYWVALEPGPHEDYLAAEWRSDPELLSQYRAIFLPEDFRALRRWLWSAARTSSREQD